MIVTGVFLKANQARIVTLSGSRASHELYAEKFNKLDLPKNPTQDDVEVFVQAFKAHCTSNSIRATVSERDLPLSGWTYSFIQKESGPNLPTVIGEGPARLFRFK